MSNPEKSARTFSDWWHGDYAREHYLIGVLVGLLLGALIGLAARVLVPVLRPTDDAVGSTHSRHVGSLETSTADRDGPG